jgi:hypothetical protein
MAQLRLARPEFSEDFGDGPGFNAAFQELIQFDGSSSESNKSSVRLECILS